MTQALREAAQALLNALDNHHLHGSQVGGNLRNDRLRAAANSVRAALSAPAPSPDERVAELMQAVDRALSSSIVSADDTYSAVESSARALLGAAQEDAEHAAMYRWLTESSETGSNERCIMKDKLRYLMCFQYFCTRQELDAAIRAAMKETK